MGAGRVTGALQVTRVGEGTGAVGVMGAGGGACYMGTVVAIEAWGGTDRDMA